MSNGQNGQGKRQKITEVRFIATVQAWGIARSHFVAGKDEAEMEFHPVGIGVKFRTGQTTREILVPYANVSHVGLESEAEAKAREAKEALKAQKSSAAA